MLYLFNKALGTFKCIFKQNCMEFIEKIETTKKSVI